MKKSKEQRQELAHNYYVTNLSIKNKCYDRLLLLVESFRRFLKESNEFDLEQYRQWVSTQAKPLLNANIRTIKTKSLSNTYKKSVSWKITRNAISIVNSQLKQKRANSCRYSTILTHLMMLEDGLLNNINKHQKRLLDLIA